MKVDPCGTVDIFEVLAEEPPTPQPAPAPVARPARPRARSTAVPRASIDEHTQAVLALLRGNPLHARDRARIVRAIVTDARAHDGHVDPGRVRRLLLHPVGGELDVAPRLIGAVYSALATTGALVFDRYIDSDDVTGRNRGKPARSYLLTRLPQEEDHR